MFVMQTFCPCFWSLASLFQLKCSWACLKNAMHLFLHRVFSCQPSSVCGEKPAVWIPMIVCSISPSAGCEMPPIEMINKETKRSWHSVTAQRKLSSLYCSSAKQHGKVSCHNTGFIVLSVDSAHCCLCLCICLQWFLLAAKCQFAGSIWNFLSLTTCPIDASGKKTVLNWDTSQYCPTTI